jgi:hypothetical protein
VKYRGVTLKNRPSLTLFQTSLKTLAVISLFATTWQFAQAIPQSTTTTASKNTTKTVKKNVSKTVPKYVPYKALSAHDAAWYKAHPNYRPSPKRGWIKSLPHRYRIVKENNQTYYYSHGHYYQRSGFGYVVVRVPFSLR